MPGRRRLSKAVHDARGHAGKRAITRRENPAPLSAGPEPPEWVREDPLALAEWNALVPERIRLGIHTRLDVNEFGRYCVFQAEFIRTLRHLRKGNIFRELEKKPVLLAMLSDIQKLLHPIELENGATPKARGSLHVSPVIPNAEEEKRKEFFGP